MDAKDAEFLKRLQATFRVEAEEHLRAITAGLIELEKTPASERRAEVVEAVFREAHSLKGAARSVNLKEIESLCQPLEGAFAQLKRGGASLSPAACDLFHQAVDAMSQLLARSDAEQTPADRSRTRDLIRQLGSLSPDATIPAKPETPKPVEEAPAVKVAPTPAPPMEVQAPVHSPIEEKKTGSVDTVRIPTAKLDALLLQAEEMVQAKMAPIQRVAELRELERRLVSWKTESATRNEPRWTEIERQTAALAHALEQDERAIKRMVDEHLDAMKSSLMLSVAPFMEAFPKVVRDLARDQGKDAELVVRGADIDIDKRILDELKDPFIHLMRNCVDHGIGKPDERARRNKAPRGTITITFHARDSRQVEILVADDGAGIDVDKIRAAAVKSGVVSRETAVDLDPAKILPLVFQSGISTSPIITDLSGRGLGLAIVREKVERLGGTVSVDSQVHVGTTFRLLVPLTLATFRGVLVRADEHLFVLPTSAVERTLRVSPEAIKTVENRETIQTNGHILSLARLGDALGMPPRRKGGSPDRASDFLFVLVLASSGKRIAFQVDEILEEQQVMVKGLGGQLRRVRNVAGATVLGNGKVVPVLNVPDLMLSAVRTAGAAKPAVAGDEALPRKGRILVAEDSITARTLLKSILETAGYHVTTAVDGADAFMQVRGGDFDLVVSDVDMPRMSGFELTEKIRADKRLAELPVVLVTALESREDRERGIDAGANAYIVKSSFDQSNLLEVIHRLL